MDHEIKKRPEGLTVLPLEPPDDRFLVPEIRLMFAILEQTLRDCLEAEDLEVLDSAVRFLLGRNAPALAKLVGVSTNGWKKLRVLGLRAAAARRRDLQIAEAIGQ